MPWKTLVCYGTRINVNCIGTAYVETNIVSSALFAVHYKKNILSLMPTSKSLIQKYTHFIQ